MSQQILGLDRLELLRGKNVLQEMKASKSKDCETGKRGIILGERVANFPFPIFSALCPPIFFSLAGFTNYLVFLLLGSSGGTLPSLVLKYLSWLFHPQHGGEETQKGSAGSPGLSSSWEGAAPELVEPSGSCRKADSRHEAWTEKLKVKY